MKPNKLRKRSLKLLSIAWAGLIFSGCTFTPSDKPSSAAIDPPPASVEAQMLQATDGQPAMAGIQTGDELTVYLKDKNGYLAPMTLSNMKSEGDTGAELAALAWMTADPKLANQLPPGFTSVLPQGTKVQTVVKNTESGAVTINFAAPLPAIPADQERKVLEALVWTMTELPGIDKVHLEVDGKALQQMPASGIPVADVLTRKIGINLEQAPNVKTSESMAVTLYFSAQNAEGDRYFVPVTRLIDRQANQTRAALGELIKGPSDTKNLQPVLLSDTTVDQLTLKDDLVSVNLKEKSWTSKTAVPTDMMQGLVLTLTEAAGLPKVELAMNGSTELQDTDNQSYAQPVTRPLQINAYPD